MLDQGPRDGDEPVDVLLQLAPVVLDEGLDLAEGLAEFLQGAGEVVLVVGEEADDLVQAFLGGAHVGVLVLQHGGEGLEAGERLEQVAAAAVEGLGGLAELLDAVADGLAVAVEVVGAGSQQLGQGTVGVGAVRAEGVAEFGDRVVDLVDLDGHVVAGGGQHGAVGEGGARAVGGGELHVAVGDDARRDDDGPRVLGDLDPVVQAEADADPGALGVHRLHLSDPHPEDAQVGPGVDADGAVEVGGDAGAAGSEGPGRGQAAGGEHHEGEHPGEDLSASGHRAPLPWAAAGCFGGRHPVEGWEVSGR